MPVLKNLSISARDARDLGSIAGSGKIAWNRKWQPAPVSCLENSMDTGAWWLHSMQLQRVGHG